MHVIALLRRSCAIATTSLVLTSGLVSAEAAAPPTAPTDLSSRQSSKKITTYVSDDARISVPRFGGCLRVSFLGQMQATSGTSGQGQSTLITFGGPTFLYSRIAVTVFKSCAAGSPVKKRQSFDQIRYSANLYGYKCSFNPSYSFGIPWSVGVSFTPDCGNKNVASLGDKQYRTARTYQYDTETRVPVAWKDSKSKRPTPYGGNNLEICTSVSVDVTLKSEHGATRPNRIYRAVLDDLCIDNGLS